MTMTTNLWLILDDIRNVSDLDDGRDPRFSTFRFDRVDRIGNRLGK